MPCCTLIYRAVALLFHHWILDQMPRLIISVLNLSDKGGILYLEGRSNSQLLISAVAKEPPKNQSSPRYFAEILLRSKMEVKKEGRKHANPFLPSFRAAMTDADANRRANGETAAMEGKRACPKWLTDSRPRPLKSLCSIISLYSLQNLILGTMTKLWNFCITKPLLCVSIFVWFHGFVRPWGSRFSNPGLGDRRNRAQ